MEILLLLDTLRGIIPEATDISLILDYILSLKTCLSLSSLRGHLVVISTSHHPIEGYSIFASPLINRVWKGLIRTFPPPQKIMPQWDLNICSRSTNKAPLWASSYLLHVLSLHEGRLPCSHQWKNIDRTPSMCSGFWPFTSREQDQSESPRDCLLW